MRRQSANSVGSQRIRRGGGGLPKRWHGNHWSSHGRERFITATSRSSGRICAVCPAKGPSGNKCFTSRLVRPRRRDRRRPSVHVFPLMVSAKTWMVGQSPTMTMKHEPCLNRFTYSSTGPKDPDKIIAAVKRGHQVLDSIH